MKKNQLIQEVDLSSKIIPDSTRDTIFKIGRSSDALVVIDDIQISREHFNLIFRNKKWFIEKIIRDSIGKINDQNFVILELNPNDVLVVKEYEIKFLLDKNTDEAIIPEKEASIEVTKSQITEEIIAHQNHEEDVEAEAVAEAIVEPVDLDTQIDFSSNDLQTDGYLDNSSSEENETIENDPQPPIEVVDDHYSLQSLDVSEDSSHDKTQMLKSFVKMSLELFGENSPYDVYNIEQNEIFIGRDPDKCQIVLKDTEVSAKHALIIRNQASLSIEDLHSSNGTILNGVRINKSPLVHNDEFVIGGVTFTVKFKSDFLRSEENALMPVDENQEIEVEEIEEVHLPSEINENDLSNPNSLSSILKNLHKSKTSTTANNSANASLQSKLSNLWKDDAQRKKIIFAIVGIAVLWLLLDDEKPQTTAANKPAVNKTSNKKQTTEKIDDTNLKRKNLSDDEIRRLTSIYEIGRTHFQNGRYSDALIEFEKVAAVDINFNSALKTSIQLAKDGLAKIEEAEKKRQAEKAQRDKEIKIKELVERAKEYVKEHQVMPAEAVFSEISKLDPENSDVSALRLELENWKKEKQKIELAEAELKKDREMKVSQFKECKNLYDRKEWYAALIKIDDLFKIKNLDNDLLTEAQKMQKESKLEIEKAIEPLLVEARRFFSGMDHKMAYEKYQEVLKIDPSNAESLNQISVSKEQLTNKARKIYRDALISESLSQFSDAKEKFSEVLNNCPPDSEYYRKAQNKLKDYLE